MMDGREGALAATPEACQRLSQQLRVLQQRLLQLDARNPSVFTGKIVSRRNFDLVSLDASIAEKAVAHVVAGGGRQRLLDEKGLEPEVVKRREHLRHVAKAAADHEEEKGLEDLRVGVAWLEGRLDDTTYVRAPLVLYPATLVRPKGERAGWTLELSKDSELQVNHALVALLHKHLRWSPDEEKVTQLTEGVEALARDKRHTMADFLRTVGAWLRESEFVLEDIDDAPQRLEPITKAEALAKGPAGLALRGYAVVGMFPQGSTALYEDYETLMQRAQDGEIDQGIIDNLLETPGDAPGEPGETRPDSIDDVPAARVAVALPCDPSQYAVLCEAQVAECTVVRGPPGTGKSQVIANMIVDALAQGERVLMVCQKRAALDVVQARLPPSLRPWSYVVHDASADRKDVYAQLRAAVQRSKEPPAASLTSARRSIAARIDRHIAAIREIVEPLRCDHRGRPVGEWYRRAPVGRRAPVRLPSPLVESSLDDVQRLLQRLERCRTDALRFSGEGAPLRGRTNWAGLGGLEQRALLDALDGIRGALATPRGELVVVSGTVLEGLRRALATYRALVDRWWKVLSGRWWKARLDVRRGTAIVGTEALERWDERLERAAQLRNGLDGLAPFFQPEWLAQLEHGVKAGDDLLARVAELHAIVRDEFDRVVQLEQSFATIDPWARDLTCADDAPLFAAADMSPQRASWAQAVEANLVLHWIDDAERRFPRLRGEPFSEYRRLRDELVGMFAEQAELTVAAVAREVHVEATRRDLSPELAGSRSRPETMWNKLEHELGKQRSVWPLRKVLRVFAWQMRQIARCWLLSPEVAAEILPLERSMFDRVIFDEASQLPLERALPVLYRCRRVVIAGDEQQMPPSRFFMASDDEDEFDEEGESIDDARTAESLLEQAKKIYGFRYLGWHYRSEHGALIDFSNQAFYDGTLHITPPPWRASSAAPIRFHRVDGVWHQQTNAAEAERCVQLIGEIARAHAEKPVSIGVIAINQKQQHAIDEALRRAEARDPEFATLVHALRHPASGARDDALVVKNIENVQGDERDVIIFSTAFARPPDDRTMRRNFGAISQAGGENRLNVAFTRARKQMHVLCSFDPDDMPVEGLKHRGPRILKAYLRYAKATSEDQRELAESLLSDLAQTMNRPHGGTPGVVLQFDSPFEEQVHRALVERGFEVDTQVGVGGYRLDLAVVNPVEPTRYCLAIECDGAMYHSGRSVRERDIARQALLEQRGWTFERIWSRDWWRNPQAEIDRIVTRIESLTAQRVSAPSLGHEAAPGTGAATST